MIPILGPWFQWVLIHAENHTIYSKITSHAHALSCIYIYIYLYVHNCIIIYPDIAPYIPIYSIYVHLSLYVQIHWTGCSYLFWRRLRQLIDLHALAQPLDGGGIQVVGVRNQAVGQLGRWEWKRVPPSSESLRKFMAEIEDLEITLW